MRSSIICTTSVVRHRHDVAIANVAGNDALRLQGLQRRRVFGQYALELAKYLRGIKAAGLMLPGASRMVERCLADPGTPPGWRERLSLPSAVIA